MRTLLVVGLFLGAPIWALDSARWVDGTSLRSFYRLSPEVFSDAPQGGTRYKLPGGVIVAFPRGWDAPRRARWSEEKRVEGSPTACGMDQVCWLVPTPPGEAGLLLANRLSDGEVTVTPNWWVGVQSKVVTHQSHRKNRPRFPRR